MRLTHFLFALFCSPVIQAQNYITEEFNKTYQNKPLKEYSRVMTYYDLWEEILFCEDTSLVYDNVFILSDEVQSSLVDSLFKSKSSWEIEPFVWIKNSNFGLNYESYGKAAIFKVDGLNFKREFLVTRCLGVANFWFRDCKLKQGLVIACQASIVQLSHCEIKGNIDVGDVNKGVCVNNLKIDSCKIELNGYHSFFLKVNSNSERGHGIEINNSNIYCRDTLAFLLFSDFETLVIRNSVFLIPVIIQSKEITEFWCSHSIFDRITFEYFPEPLTFVCQWSVLKGVLANDSEGDDYLSLSQFDAWSNALDDVEAYDELMSKYKALHEIYKSRGDMVSANGSYLEMKDVETKRLLYIYNTAGGINNYFKYKLNVFLGYVADYGTNPVKCIIYAIYVIFLFALFYLLFYSKWDNINHKFMLKRGLSFIHFFKGEQKRDELYTDNYKEHIYSFDEFKKNIQEAKGQIPFFFFLFLRPVYWTANTKIRINEWFYNRLDFTRKSWASLNKKQKASYGTFYFIALLFYGLYLLIIKFLTAFVISFNSFSSLGFGSLNLTGVTRYLAMVEGFIGWLLLSVFSISLFSQIIQG